MEIKINISKKDLKHLKNCYSYLDACGVVSNIIKKVKEQMNENGN